MHPRQRENLREYIDRLHLEGYRVLDGHTPDPDLIDPGGRAVETWREGYPYDERMDREDYELEKYHLQSRPNEFDVVVTMNLNGDYVSDALAAQVGGIGIAPGANINYDTGHAIFEATHGTAPKYAGLDKVNPSSVILS